MVKLFHCDKSKMKSAALFFWLRTSLDVLFCVNFPNLGFEMFSSAVSPNRPGFVSLTNFHESWFQPSSPESYFSSLPASPGYTDTLEPPGFKATVESEGYVQLLLGQGMTVDIAPNKAICLSNKEYGTVISLSGCGTQVPISIVKFIFHFIKSSNFSSCVNNIQFQKYHFYSRHQFFIL